MPAVSKEPSKISVGFGDSELFDAERAPSESQGQSNDFNQERSQDNGFSRTFGDESSLNGPRDDSNYS